MRDSSFLIAQLIIKKKRDKVFPQRRKEVSELKTIIELSQMATKESISPFYIKLSKSKTYSETVVLINKKTSARCMCNTYGGRFVLAVLHLA